MKLKIKKIWFYGWWLTRFTLKMCLSLLISLALRRRDEYRNLWLIMELPQEARDNGYWLYKYIVDNHPEINVRYVLSDKSPDYVKMPAKDRIIKPYSWKHYISYILCTRSISTHIYGASPGRYYARLFALLIPKRDEVFLQHGITKEPIPLRGFSDWIVTASPSEASHLVDSGHRSPERIINVGFCRFDNLTDLSRGRNEKIILIMPTYRNWLGGHTSTSSILFKEDDFYKKWQSLLSNKELNQFIEESGYKIIFYPHRQMQQFTKHFSAPGVIEIATMNDYDVQELLRRAALLITDYSSVFYDFSYMKKPVLLYPFDKKRFYVDHHKYSGKPYPFGEYCQSEPQLVKSIKGYGQIDFKISEKDESRIKEFFTYTDTSNCERNFNAIKGLGEK